MIYIWGFFPIVLYLTMGRYHRAQHIAIKMPFRFDIFEQSLHICYADAFMKGELCKLDILSRDKVKAIYDSQPALRKIYFNSLSLGRRGYTQ